MKKIYFYLLSGGSIISTPIEPDLSTPTVVLAKCGLSLQSYADGIPIRNFTLHTQSIIGSWVEEFGTI